MDPPAKEGILIPPNFLSNKFNGLYEGAIGRLGQRNISCYKCNKMGHISSECCKEQNDLVGTSKGKKIMSEWKSDGDDEDVHDDVIV